MKTLNFLKGALIPMAGALSLCSCDLLNVGLEADASLVIRFADESCNLSKSQTPDPDDFRLTVSSEDGNVIYDGLFGASPQSIPVSAGNYTVKAVSEPFDAPLFDKRQFGDTQVVAVASGEVVPVTLECSQINAGIKVRYTPEFRSEYPQASFVMSSSEGQLAHSYLETRTAFFKPGKIRMSMYDKSVEKTLFTVTLAPKEILSVTVGTGNPKEDAPGNSSGSYPGTQAATLVTIRIDTLASRSNAYFSYAESGAGGSDADASNAWSITKAKQNVGAEDVWVQGFIVGGDLTSSKCSFTAPFTSRTNIVIAERSSCTDKSLCMSVQLAKGDIRDALNLVDNPGLLGQKVWLKGDIVNSYYGINGIQSISDYKLK